MTDDASVRIAAYKYLVIDDEVFMQKMLLRMLKTLGAENTSAVDNGQSALAVLDSADTPPDILLCDLNMPGMDGIEFLRHVATRNYPGGIVLISGEDARVLNTVVELAKVHDLNILGSLSKPIKPPALGEILATYGQNVGHAQRGPGAAVTVEDLREAIENDQLTLFYQPKVSVETRELVAVEALVRWIHPDKGLIPPDAFISVAEEFGLINDLTNVVAKKAIRQAGGWMADGLDIKVAINVSVENLNQLEFPEFIMSTATDEGVPASRIILEVTESRLMSNLASSLEILSRLRIKGLDLSIDDFGTGHSSMEQLKRIPFTELKIDRAFVNGAGRDPATRAILETAVGLAKRLNLRIVAEGVEDQEDWDQIASLGVDMVQGYFVSRPLPIEDFPAWLESWSAANG